jgi:hypothetical protein
MRDFRDAKAMAHTLRAALATKGHKVTNSQSLEPIAQAFGVADWEYSLSHDPRGGGWACKVDLGALKEKLTNYIDNDLRTLVIDDGGDPAFSAWFSAHYAEVWSLPTRTGAELFVAIFAETESPAARLLGGQDMTRQDAFNFIIHGFVKGGGDTAA